MRRVPEAMLWHFVWITADLWLLRRDGDLCVGVTAMPNLDDGSLSKADGSSELCDDYHACRHHCSARIMALSTRLGVSGLLPPPSVPICV